MAEKARGATHKPVRLVGDGAAMARRDLSTEVSYKGGKLTSYRGKTGSIRVDAVEGFVDRPTAIYELKTGSAQLTVSRVDTIRQNLPKGYKDIPIIEIRPP